MKRENQPSRFYIFSIKFWLAIKWSPKIIKTELHSKWSPKTQVQLLYQIIGLGYLNSRSNQKYVFDWQVDKLYAVLDLRPLALKSRDRFQFNTHHRSLVVAQINYDTRFASNLITRKKCGQSSLGSYHLFVLELCTFPFSLSTLITSNRWINYQISFEFNWRPVNSARTVTMDYFQSNYLKEE